MDYFTTKTVFDKEKIKQGYFIEVSEILNPLNRPKRGIITYVSENIIAYINSQKVVLKVTVEEIEECIAGIKVAKDLSSQYIGLTESNYFIIRMIERVEIEHGDENNETTLHLNVNKDITEQIHRIKLNGVPYYPVFGAPNFKQRTTHINLYNDPSPKEEIDE